MTISFPTVFLHYWLFTIVFETIYQYIAISYVYKDFKQSPVYEAYMPILNSFKEIPQWNTLMKAIFNPATYITVYVIFCMVTPILFVFTVITNIRKLLFGKSLPDKHAEQFFKDKVEESQKINDDFMQNEGAFNPNHDFSVEEPSEVITVYLVTERQTEVLGHGNYGQMLKLSTFGGYDGEPYPAFVSREHAQKYFNIVGQAYLETQLTEVKIWKESKDPIYNGAVHPAPEPEINTDDATLLRFIDEQLITLTNMQLLYFMHPNSFSPQDYNKISEMIGNLKEYFINCDSYKNALLNRGKKD